MSAKFKHISGNKENINNEITCNKIYSTYRFSNIKHNLHIFLEINSDLRTFDIHHSESSMRAQNKPHYSEFNFIEQKDDSFADLIAELIYNATKFAKEKLLEQPITISNEDEERQLEFKASVKKTAQQTNPFLYNDDVTDPPF